MKLTDRRKGMAFALLIGLLFGFSAQAFAQESRSAADFCWAETTGRGVGTIPGICAADQEKNGLLCYPKCQAGYKSDGVLGCIQECPAGATEDGLYCGWPSYKAAEYPIWDEAKCKREHSTGCWLTVPVVGVWVETCRAGFHHVAGFCEKETINCAAEGLAGNRIANSCAKKLYSRTTILPACGSGTEYDAGLCYTPCADGATGVGPECWAKGPPGWVQCGMGYAKDDSICKQNIAMQVLSVVDAVASTSILIGSLGASSAGVSSIFNKSAWEAAKSLGKITAKDALKAVAVSTATQTLGNASDAVLATTDGAIEQVWDIGRLQYDSPNLTKTERDFAIAQIALNTAAWVDPTGVAGIVAAYSKPICKDISAMNVTSSTVAPATTQPSGTLASLMAEPQVIQGNFTTQIAAAKATYDGATTSLNKVKAAYDSAQPAMKPLLAASVTAATASQASAKEQLDKITAASEQFSAVAAKWQPILGKPAVAPPVRPAPIRRRPSGANLQ